MKTIKKIFALILVTVALCSTLIPSSYAVGYLNRAGYSNAVGRTYQTRCVINNVAHNRVKLQFWGQYGNSWNYIYFYNQAGNCVWCSVVSPNGYCELDCGTNVNRLEVYSYVGGALTLVSNSRCYSAICCGG